MQDNNYIYNYKFNHFMLETKKKKKQRQQISIIITKVASNKKKTFAGWDQNKIK